MVIKTRAHATTLTLLVFLYCVFRLLIILSNSETISYELFRGTLAKEFIEGLRLPLSDFITDPYSMAALFNGLLTAPFFQVFGSSLFTLKLVPFFWHLGSLVAWFLVWQSFFSLRQTGWILLLFILAPPPIIEFSLSNHGTHFELILWTALSLLILRRMLLGKFSVIQGGVLLGLLGGFTCSLALTNLVTAACVLLYSGLALSRNKKSFYLAYGINFLLGFAPFLLYNAFHNWGAVDFLKSIVSGTTLDLLPLHFYQVFLNWGGGLKGLLAFRGLPRPLTPLFTYGYEVIYLLSLFYLIFSKWGFWKSLPKNLNVEIFSLIYQVVLFGLVLLTPFSQGSQYLFPLVPFMGMTIVSAVQKTPALVKYSLLGFCLVSGMIGSLSLVRWKDMGGTLSLQGYSYSELGQVFKTHFGRDLGLFEKKMKVLLENKNSSIKKAFYEGAVTFDIFPVDRRGESEKILELINRVEPEFQPIFFNRLGIALGIFLQFDSRKLANYLDTTRVSTEFQPSFYRGAVEGLTYMEEFDFIEKAQKGLALCKKAPVFVKPSCYEALGEFVEPGLGKI